MSSMLVTIVKGALIVAFLVAFLTAMRSNSRMMKRMRESGFDLQSKGLLCGMEDH